MLADEKRALQLAEALFRIGAIKISPSAPFRWASGWLSPIYTDNRLTLSYPEVRRQIRDGFAALSEGLKPRPQVIAGVATGGIAHGVLLAEALDLPFLYVRSSAKGHGLGNQIEGQLNRDAVVLVVEDLVSTGGSSLGAVKALREQGAIVHHMLAVYDYDFPQKQKAFEQEKITLFSLGNFETTLLYASQHNLISPEQLNILRIWRTNPAQWTPVLG
jgi:orotate phosphoribosyltransferase